MDQFSPIWLVMHEAGQGSHAPSCAVGGRKNEPLIIGIICQNVNRSLVEILHVAINDHSCRYTFLKGRQEQGFSQPAGGSTAGAK